MAEISVANKDWSIVGAVKAALAGATIEGQAAFQAVRVTASEVDFRGVQMREKPVAVVRYVTTVEDRGLDGERNCRLSAELLVATMVQAAGVDEAGRIQEALRLANAAKNAVESAVPADAEAVGDGNFHARRIDWGRVALDATTARPWAIATLPVTFGYLLNSGTAH